MKSQFQKSKEINEFKTLNSVIEFELSQAELMDWINGFSN